MVQGRDWAGLTREEEVPIRAGEELTSARDAGSAANEKKVAVAHGVGKMAGADDLREVEVNVFEVRRDCEVQ